MTPSYQLTRLLWWFRSPVSAVAAGGLLLGLVYVGLASLQPENGLAGVALLGFGFVAVGVVGAWAVWIARGRWAECEGLSDWERARLVHAVHFGLDTGSPHLASATVEFAKWKRANLERRGSRLPLLGLFAIQFFFQALNFRTRAPVGALVLVVLAVLLAWFAWRIDRTREQRLINLWNAEWYAAERLGGSAAPSG